MSDMKLGIVFDVENGKFKSEVKQNAQVIKSFGNSTVRTANQARQLDTALAQTNAKLIATNNIAQKATRAISGLAAGFGAGFLLKELSNTTQKFQVLRATLQTATGSKEKAADAFARLQKFAAATPYSVEESIQAFIKLKNLGLDPTEAALNSYGNTASAMGKSLDQFIEAVADASVSEFERLKEFGIKAKNQGDTIAFTFRKNKTDVANNAAAIEAYLQNLGNNEFGGAMARQAATFDGALSNMGDAWDQLLLKISDAGAGNAMEAVVRGVASSLNVLGQHTEQITTLFSVGLVVASAHAAKAISAKTAATAKDLLTSRASAIAVKTQAESEYNLARAYKASAVGSTQNTIADRRLIATRAALTTATSKASIATRALSGAMALLGGPAGIALLAGFALYSFATNADDADSKVQGLSRTIDVALGKHKALETQALQTDIDERMTRLAQLQQKITDIHAKLAVGHNQKLGLLEKGVISDSIEEAKKLGAEIGLLQTKLDSLSGKSSEGGKPTEEGKTTDKDALGVSQLATLKQRVALFNEHSKVKQLQYSFEHGALAGVDSQLKQQLLDEAVKLDLLNKQKAARDKTPPDTPLDINEQRALEDNNRHDQQAAELAALRGFQVEKSALIGLTNADEIAQASARNLAIQEEEYAHNEAIMAMKTRKTGDMQGVLMQFANYEKKTQLEKTQAVISLGEYGFKAMAGQSKKAFAMYKAFSIGQALIKTYEAATGAYSAMASIPYIGPALGVAAAAAAVVSGMAQVKQIKAQKPQGFERGGFIGDHNVIEFGEGNKAEVLAFEGHNYLLGGNQGQVFNQQQLTEINSGNGGDSIVINSSVTIQGNADESVITDIIARNSEAVYHAYIQAKDDIGEMA